LGNPNRAMVCAVCILVGLLAAGCGDDEVSGPGGDLDSEASESFHYRFDAGSQSKLTVQGVSGEIEITGVAGTDSIVVRGTRRVRSWDAEDAASHLNLLEVTVTNLAGEVRAETSQPDESGGRSYEVDYEIIIPVNLQVVATGVNGTISVASVTEPVAALTVNGSIDLAGIEASVDVEAVNGAIEGDVSLPPGRTIDMDVVNGEINIDIPSSTSAEFSAEVVNGSVTVSGLPLEDMVVTAESVTGTLGAGEGEIMLRVVNGTIRVEGF
jgi:hypothetical protein